MERFYAIGDIHGQLDKLRVAHDMVAQDRDVTGDETAQLVHLGDLTDRGPHSRQVVDLLLQGIADGQPWHCIKGNHDRMMWLYLQENPKRDPILKAEYEWTHEALGGSETLESYGIAQPYGLSHADLHAAARQVVPKEHIDFLGSLDTVLESEDLIFCHAGIRPGIPVADQVEDDLVWIRKDFHDDPRDHGKLVVHGHTPVKSATHHGNRVNLDTGAGYGRDVTAAVFEGRDCWILTPNGRVPLTP